MADEVFKIITVEEFKASEIFDTEIGENSSTYSDNYINEAIYTTSIIADYFTGFQLSKIIELAQNQGTELKLAGLKYAAIKHTQHLLRSGPDYMRGQSSFSLGSQSYSTTNPDDPLFIVPELLAELAKLGLLQKQFIGSTTPKKDGFNYFSDESFNGKTKYVSYLDFYAKAVKYGEAHSSDGTIDIIEQDTTDPYKRQFDLKVNHAKLIASEGFTDDVVAGVITNQNALANMSYALVEYDPFLVLLSSQEKLIENLLPILENKVEPIIEKALENSTALADAVGDRLVSDSNFLDKVSANLDDAIVNQVNDVVNQVNDLSKIWKIETVLFRGVVDFDLKSFIENNLDKTKHYRWDINIFTNSTQRYFVGSFNSETITALEDADASITVGNYIYSLVQSTGKTAINSLITLFLKIDTNFKISLGCYYLYPSNGSSAVKGTVGTGILPYSINANVVITCEEVPYKYIETVNLMYKNPYELLNWGKMPYPVGKIFNFEIYNNFNKIEIKSVDFYNTGSSSYVDDLTDLTPLDKTIIDKYFEFSIDGKIINCTVLQEISKDSTDFLDLLYNSSSSLRQNFYAQIRITILADGKEYYINNPIEMYYTNE